MHWDDPVNRDGQGSNAYAQESAAHYTERILFFADLLAQKREEHAPDKTINALQASITRYSGFLKSYLETTKYHLSKGDDYGGYLLTGNVVHVTDIVEIRDKQNRIHAFLPDKLDRVPKVGERVMLMINKEGEGKVSSVGEHQLRREPSYEMGR